MTEPVRIVVADDDPDLLELLRLNLEAEGHTVKVACDGDEAFQLAVAARPDLLWPDGIHPRPAGARLYARVVLTAIRAALSRVKPSPCQRPPRRPDHPGAISTKRL